MEFFFSLTTQGVKWVQVLKFMRRGSHAIIHVLINSNNIPSIGRCSLAPVGSWQLALEYHRAVLGQGNVCCNNTGVRRIKRQMRDSSPHWCCEINEMCVRSNV